MPSESRCTIMHCINRQITGLPNIHRLWMYCRVYHATRLGKSRMVVAVSIKWTSANANPLQNAFLISWAGDERPHINEHNLCCYTNGAAMPTKRTTSPNLWYKQHADHGGTMNKTPPTHSSCMSVAGVYCCSGNMVLV